MHWVYIIECNDGTLYTGWTIDIDKRIEKHNKGLGAKYTRTRYPVALKYSEEYATKREALQREYYIKQMSRIEKLELIVLQEKSKSHSIGSSNLCIKKSFNSIVNANSRVLILGSMPGEESLRKQEYYAYAKNQFWPIIYTIFDRELDLSYERRVEFLLEKGIALWDVIERCERKGSLDANIRNERPNDINGLLENNPKIVLVCFNGTKAYETYKKKTGFLKDDKIKYQRLPSTSPIPGKNIKSFAEKVEDWKIILEYL
ncbi:MAG: DNA-deoxyinosine glycosylase [Firmicutes bacterium HGW-Firmicutes-12]|nr:MAG: DNA-deoxyinosine glycosylase [Firmicutes bacterium HGW-Firmicutes-12]